MKPAAFLPHRARVARVVGPLACAACLLVPASLIPGTGLGLVPTASAQAVPADPAVPAAPGRPRVVVPEGGEFGKDLAIDLPAWPEDRDLAELTQRVRPDLRFFVDRRSIALAPGGEFRYTFVVRNAGGARSVTFESMRCEKRERMILATGSADRNWSPARFMRWESLDRNDPAGMREILFRDIFCPDRLPVASLKAALAALKTGLPTRDLATD